jgi:hypothetical protein
MFRRVCVLLGASALSAVLIALNIGDATGRGLTDEELSAKCGSSSSGEWCWPHEDCDDATSPCPGDPQRCQGKSSGDFCGEDPEYLYPECCNPDLGNETCSTSPSECAILCSRGWQCHCDYFDGLLWCLKPIGAAPYLKACTTDPWACNVITVSCIP